MRPRPLSGRTPCRRGAAAVEAAILLPFLLFLFLVAVDYCRLFYFSQVVTNCARNGAAYLSDPVIAAQSPYPTVQEAAKADAPNAEVRGQLVVTPETGTTP